MVWIRSRGKSNNVIVRKSHGKWSIAYIWIQGAYTPEVGLYSYSIVHPYTYMRGTLLYLWKCSFL